MPKMGKFKPFLSFFSM